MNRIIPYGWQSCDSKEQKLRVGKKRNFEVLREHLKIDSFNGCQEWRKKPYWWGTTYRTRKKIRLWKLAPFQRWIWTNNTEPNQS